jgi:hypothetical protein
MHKLRPDKPTGELMFHHQQEGNGTQIVSGHPLTEDRRLRG